MTDMTMAEITPETRRRTIMAGVVGNVLEWYDFAVYGYFAPIIAGIFFPSEDPVASLVAAFGAFAAGFLMRPFGGLVFGYIGDKIGRKRALVLSVTLMAIPTCVIGLLPGHATIGAAAAVLMVVMRMLQGLSVGGEYTSSVVFLTEHAPKGRRGYFSSWALFGAVGGILLGSAVSAVMSNLLDAEALHAWGWRLPFVMGIAVGLVGLLVRRGIHDLPAPADEDKPKNPVVEAFTHQWRSMLRVIGFNVVNAVGFYMIFVYMVTWLVKKVKEPRSDALDLNTAALVVLCLLIPAAGALSDRVGRKPLLLFGTGGLLVFGWPLIWLMHHLDPALILLGQVGLAVFIACYFGAIPAAMAEAFPRRVRVSALSVGYNVCLAVFGGTTPMVSTWLIERSHDDLAIAWYLMLAAAVSLTVVLRMKETANNELD
jgi:MHS family proline/betaine transporter-like MFS transporter